MRYFFDCEFNDTGSIIDLISIGIIGEDDREFYAVSNEFDPSLANLWVQENVYPQLESRESEAWKSRDEIREGILEFVGDDPRPEFWAYSGAYDWVSLVQLFGRLIDIPNGWPRFVRDLRDWRWRLGDPALPFKIAERHHALDDARRNKRAYEFLETFEARSRLR